AGAIGMSSFRILSGSDGKGLPDGRENRRGSDLIQSAVGSGRKENPPLRWMESDLDSDPLPLRAAPPVASASIRASRGSISRGFLEAVRAVAFVPPILRPS